MASTPPDTAECEAPPTPFLLPDLPDDVLTTILSLLSAECVVAASRTCRGLHRVAASPWLWRAARVAEADASSPVDSALSTAAAAALRAPPPAAPLLVTIRVEAYPRSDPPTVEATLLPHAASLRAPRAAAAAELAAGLAAQTGGPIATAIVTRGHCVRATLCPVFFARAAVAAGKRVGWPPEQRSPPLPLHDASSRRRRRVAPVDLGLFSSLMFDWSSHAAQQRAAAHTRLRAAAPTLLPGCTVHNSPRATWPLVIAAGEDGMEAAARTALVDALAEVGATASGDEPSPRLIDGVITLALLSPRLCPSRPAAFGGLGAPLAALRDGAAIVAELVRWKEAGRDGCGGNDAPPADSTPTTPADATAAYLASYLLDAVASAATEGGVAPIASLAARVCAALHGARGTGAAVAPVVADECVRTVAWCAWLCGVDVEAVVLE